MARQLHLSAKITVCRYNELTDNEKILVDKARAAVKGAYAPYSGFRVGAAIELADGRHHREQSGKRILPRRSLCRTGSAFLRWGDFARHASGTAGHCRRKQRRGSRFSHNALRGLPSGHARNRTPLCHTVTHIDVRSRRHIHRRVCR